MHPSVRQIDLLDDNWMRLSFTSRCHYKVSGACHMHVICDLIHSRLQNERNGLWVLIKRYEVSRLGTGKTVLRQSKPNPRINQNTKKTKNLKLSVNIITFSSTVILRHLCGFE